MPNPSELERITADTDTPMTWQQMSAAMERMMAAAPEPEQRTRYTYSICGCEAWEPLYRAFCPQHGTPVLSSRLVKASAYEPPPLSELKEYEGEWV